jgi:hypothetical protein
VKTAHMRGSEKHHPGYPKHHSRKRNRAWKFFHLHLRIRILQESKNKESSTDLLSFWFFIIRKSVEVALSL